MSSNIDYSKPTGFDLDLPDPWRAHCYHNTHIYGVFGGLADHIMMPDGPREGGLVPQSDVIPREADKFPVQKSKAELKTTLGNAYFDADKRYQFMRLIEKAVNQTPTLFAILRTLKGEQAERLKRASRKRCPYEYAVILHELLSPDRLGAFAARKKICASFFLSSDMHMQPDEDLRTWERRVILGIYNFDQAFPNPADFFSRSSFSFLHPRIRL